MVSFVILGLGSTRGRRPDAPFQARAIPGTHLFFLKRFEYCEELFRLERFLEERFDT